jgi:putative ABC transport system permease protein
MRWMNDLWFRARALFGRRAMERDLSDEFAFHLEMETKKLEAQGLTPEEARRRAYIHFGGEERHKEHARASWGVGPLHDFDADVRFALRQLLKRPAFTALAALTLALGIGGTVALFSVVHGLMIRPLPVHDEGRLFTFWSDYNWRGVEFDFVKERIQTFEGLAAYSDGATTLRTEAGSRLILYSVASAELFDVLGTRPMLGRAFVEGEDRPGAEHVVVLSHGLWERELGGDRDVLGRRIELGGVARTVIGVMPRGFYFPSPESEAWIPLELDPASQSYQNDGWLVLLGRVWPGTTQAQIDADLEQVATQLGERWDYPDAWDKTRNPHVTPLREYLLGDVRPALLLLLGAVALVLLIACANVAALLLTRTADRTGEMGVRTALGAGRARLARQVLTESIVLGVLAGLLGAALAVAAFDVLVASLPLPRELDETLALDWTALLSSLFLAILTGSLISLGPIRSLLRGDLSGAALGSRSESGATRSKGRAQRALVAGEVLLAVVLATGAALLIRTVGELRALDWGLDPEGVLTADVIQPDTDVNGARPTFYETLLERVAALPGVQAVGLINRIPVRDGGWQATLTLADRPDLTGDRRPNAYYRPVSPDVFGALGIEILEGRGIGDTDTEDAPRVAVVNETFARSMFGEESALGRIIDSHVSASGPIEIVGVIRDVAVDDLVGDVPMAVYYPWAQTLGRAPYAILVAKTSLDPSDLVTPVRAIVDDLEPDAVLGRVETMEEVMESAMAEPLRLRFFLAIFSVLGIVLGTVGVYGVVSYAVERRRPEFGIRMALGAAPSRLLREVVRNGMLPVAVGVVAGAAVALLASTVLAGFLFGVEPTDPTSLMTAAGALLVAGVCAAFVPAWRATRIHPAVALRTE